MFGRYQAGPNDRCTCSDRAPEDDAEIKFNQFVDVIRDAALAALSRDSDQTIIVVSENDLDQ
jgi:hypothetical protein